MVWPNHEAGKHNWVPFWHTKHSQRLCENRSVQRFCAEKIFIQPTDSIEGTRAAGAPETPHRSGGGRGRALAFRHRWVELLAGADGFAEVYPEDKRIVVQNLQAAGHVTGVTGHGVNDTPALRQAEVRIAVSTATRSPVRR